MTCRHLPSYIVLTGGAKERESKFGCMYYCKIIIHKVLVTFLSHLHDIA